MKNKILLAFCLLIITVLAANSAAAQNASVGVYLLNLGKFDVATGSFTADFYLSMKCSSNCPSESFEFANGRASSIDKIINKPKEKFYRIQANLNSPVDLKKFPFDRQEMRIILEDKNSTIEELRYVPLPDESGIDGSITFVGWNLNGWNVDVKEHYYSAYNETYSQYVFTVSISRIALSSFMKTFLPVFLILMVVLLSLVLDPDKIPTRITMAGSSLVASVMFHISISNQIPPVGYLTFADKFMVLTYFILVLIFLINIVLLELQESKKSGLVEKIHHSTEFSMLFITPILYLVLFFFFI